MTRITYKPAAMLAAVVLGVAFSAASAKLPAPTDDQKAKAAEAKTKADEAAKKDAELLTKAQDRATDNYKKGKVTKTGAAAAKK